MSLNERLPKRNLIVYSYKYLNLKQCCVNIIINLRKNEFLFCPSCTMNTSESMHLQKNFCCGATGMMGQIKAAPRTKICFKPKRIYLP